MNIAGRDITEYVQKYITEDGISFESSAEKEIAKDIKEKCCYVSLKYEEEKKEFLTNNNKKKDYELPDGRKI